MHIGKYHLLKFFVAIALTVMLMACGQLDSVSEEAIIDEAVFSDSAVQNSASTLISEEFELLGVDLNNEEVNIEGPEDEELVEVESELSSQAVLAGSSGYLAYYRRNGSSYEIWVANQSDDTKVKVWANTDKAKVNSVAVDGTGNLLVASISYDSGFDVYLFDIAATTVTNLTNTSTKDEIDVSMTADGLTIVYSKPTNAGLSKINVCKYSSTTNSCIVGVLGATEAQRQASITSNGEYITLIRDLSDGRYRVLLYDRATGMYTTVATRPDELSHPSANYDGTNIMYLRDRTASIGKDLVRIKNLNTNVVYNELSKPDIGHPHMRPGTDFFTYRDDSSNGTRAFTRNIATNDRASSQAGSWDYYAPYWQIEYQAPANVLAYAVNTSLNFTTYTPATAYNRSGGTVTMYRASTGRYTVEFAGLDLSRGSVHVTTLNSVAKCSVVGWGGITAAVTCRNASTGAEQDSLFSVSFTANDSSNAKIVAYVWANNKAATSSYTPLGNYSYNSAAGSVSVNGNGSGNYVVQYNDLNLPNNYTVQITARDANRFCNWKGGGITNHTVLVDCYDHNGNLATSRFTVTTITNASTDAKILAYAVANNPSAANYTPLAAYSYNATGGNITAIRTGTGTYQLNFTGLNMSQGNLQVSAFSDNIHCASNGWGGDDAYVNCYNSAGNLVNSAYTVQYTAK